MKKKKKKRNRGLNQSVRVFALDYFLSTLNIWLKNLWQKSYCKANQEHPFLEVNWSDLHLSSFHRVVMSFPGTPVDTISIWPMFTTLMIQTIQVRMMTIRVPPGSFEGHSTAPVAATVIILIFGCKRITTMTGKRITSRSWKEDEIPNIEDERVQSFYVYTIK